MGSLTLESFRNQLHDVLNHLYDYVYLEKHPLSRILVDGSRSEGTHRGHRLRRLILEAIESTAPPQEVRTGSREWRRYQILCSRFVDQRTPQEVMREVLLSERQFYREQRRALDALAYLLWKQLIASREGDKRDSQEAKSRPSALLTEVEKLPRDIDYLDVQTLLDGVTEVVSVLARKRNVRITVRTTEQLPPIRVERVLVRQALIKLLTCCLTIKETRSLSITATAETNQVVIEIAVTPYTGSSPMTSKGFVLDSVHQLLNWSQGHWLGERVNNGVLYITLSFPSDATHTILAVEDNPSAVRLFRRFAKDSGYNIVAVPDAEKALEFVHKTPPDCIILDIMLPRQDGWELLRQLRGNAILQRIPVIVCSVLDQRELALAMGADAYLQKPFSQSAFLDTLHMLSP